MSTIMSLKDVNKIYPSGVHAVYDFNIDIEQGEFIVFCGPSGCGKSTTLRMIAGLEDITSGDLVINGRRCNDLAPRDRDIAMVFQNYALYAHMTVYHNLAFSLMIRKMDKDEIHRRVMEAADVLGLIPYLNRKPKQLSGGQRQRVAVGRAIVRNPIVYLLDEPLSNLDAKLRASMRKELASLHYKLHKTFIYVTHDQIEALTLASRIVVMKDGYVQQIATPKEMFDNPYNTFVAGFIGTPPMNFYHGVITKDLKFNQIDPNLNLALTYEEFEEVESKGMVNTPLKATVDGNMLKVAGLEIELKEAQENEEIDVIITSNKYLVKLTDLLLTPCKNHQEDLKEYVGKEVIMASRPDYVYLEESRLKEFKDMNFKLDVEYSEHLGAYNLVYGTVNGERCIAKVNGREVVTQDQVKLAFDSNRVHFFDVDSEVRISRRFEKEA